MSGKQFYVSITGLRINKPWQVFHFFRHAIPCYYAARQTPGNISAEVKTINSINHTLTVWENREAMLTFLMSPTHARAMKVFPEFASGKTYGFETDQVPSWEEVPDLWLEHGKEYGT